MTDESTELHAGQRVISADGLAVGIIEQETPTHLGLRAVAEAPTGQLWLPRTLVGSVEGDVVRLTVPRAALHEAVLSLPPRQQREFASLGLSVRIGRERGMKVGTPTRGSQGSAARAPDAGTTAAPR